MHSEKQNISKCNEVRKNPCFILSPPVLVSMQVHCFHNHRCRLCCRLLSLANILSLFKNNWGWNKRVNCMWFRNEVGCQWIANWLHSTWEPLQEWSCLPRVMIRWSILLFIDWNEETQKLIFEFKNCSFQEGLHCIHFRTGQHIDFKSSQVEPSLASRRFNIA